VLTFIHHTCHRSFGGDLHALSITVMQMLFYCEVVVVQEEVSLAQKRGFDTTNIACGNERDRESKREATGVANWQSLTTLTVPKVSLKRYWNRSLWSSLLLPLLNTPPTHPLR